MVETAPLTHASVTVGMAANATGFSPRGLRLALGTGEKLPMLGDVERRAGCWRRFSAVDVVRLAVLSRLVNHGFTVGEAASVIVRKVDPHLSGLVGCGV